ncbi:MAG TPA: protein translocase subunit SecD [Candidatus Saccharimonadales bacterium]|nr:protein translocase subunit SecD [Candidatus Saccharimonadales bacterium]
MRRNFWLGLVAILLVIGVAAYISTTHASTFLKRKIEVRQGLDLQGGVELTYSLDLSKTAPADQQTAISSTQDVIERRVNSTGVSEPVIEPSKIGNQQVLIVELPGIKDVESAIKLIGTTAQLDFRSEDSSTTTDSSNPNWVSTGLTGKQLTNATLTFDSTTNAPQISLQFNSAGTKLFSDITTQNVGKPIAIFLDNQEVSAPTVQEAITTGQAVITGQFTVQQAKDIVNLLNDGALQVPLKQIAQTTIGATLGVQSVKNSIVAGIIGLALVILFMLLNYRLAGLVATLALFSYGLITFALFKAIPVTLTLSGIAGFILSIGMAVDANILIFERMREELRAGKDLHIAMEEAFRRAWPSVRDSNMATIITCAILYFTTSGSVRGFALTLGLGVVISLFSSITVSRYFLRLFAMNPLLARGLEKV